MKISEFNIPDNLYYTKEHEWAHIESSNKVRIGITDYAQKALHEIVFVEAPSEGSDVKHMESIGTVESVKAVSEIYSPVSGHVVVINKILEMNPELVNQDPYGKGWIVIIDPSDLKKELEELLTPNQYAEHIQKLLSEK